MQVLSKVVLGVDYGSTAIRAILIPRDRRLLPKIVWNHNAIPGCDEGYQKGAYRSAVYVDGEGVIYAGEDADLARIPVASKVFFLEQPVTGIGPFDEALKGPRASTYKSLAATGQREILQTVLRGVIKTCNEKSGGGPFEVDAIALSYSAHWTAYERNRYEERFNQVLSEPEFIALSQHRPEIHFVAESLSSAHNLFSNEGHIEAVLGTSTEPTLLLFLDFGGHTLVSSTWNLRCVKHNVEYLLTKTQNGCMFSVARRPGKDLCYLRVGETFAVKGGTQIWEQEIRKIIIDMFRQEFNTEPSPRQCSEMLDSFHGRIKKWNSNEVDMLGLTYTTLDLTSVRTLNIRREDVKTCFKAALDGPIDAAKEKIAEACSMSEGNVKVVVSGGSGKNSVLQAFVRQACKEEGISHPYFFYENAGAHDSWNVAKGAAICTASDMTVQSFFDQGAALGLQKSSRKGRKPPDHDFWDVPVKVALTFNMTQSFKQHFSGKSRLKIICNPSQSSDTSNAPLDIDTTYDLLELPTPANGYWEFCLSLEESEGSVSLGIKRKNWGTNGKRLMGCKAFPSVPLEFDQQSNVCLIQSEVDDKGRGLMMSESGNLEACPESVIQEQLSALKHVRGKQSEKRPQAASQLRRTVKRPPGEKPHRPGPFDASRFRLKDGPDAAAGIGTAAEGVESITGERPEPKSSPRNRDVR